MIMDVIDRPSNLTVSQSRWAGQPVSELRVRVQNSRAAGVEQALNKKVCCRVLDARCRSQGGGDLMQERIWCCESWDKVERTADPIVSRCVLPITAGQVTLS